MGRDPEQMTDRLSGRIRLYKRTRTLSRPFFRVGSNRVRGEFHIIGRVVKKIY